MDSYYSYSTSSSSSGYVIRDKREAKRPPTLPSLHLVRKPFKKPLKKQPIAPPPPPPRVYKVDPANFREVVQKLTGAPPENSSSRSRLQSVAPSPLNVVTPPPSVPDVSAPLQLFSPLGRSPFGCGFNDLLLEAPETKAAGKFFDGFSMNNSIGFGLSPSSYAWGSFPLLSPGTLSSFEQSMVL